MVDLFTSHAPIFGFGRMSDVPVFWYVPRRSNGLWGIQFIQSIGSLFLALWLDVSVATHATL